MITSPADERFISEQTSELLVAKDEIRVKVKAWSNAPVSQVNAMLGERTIHLANVSENLVWEGHFIEGQLPTEGVRDLLIEMKMPAAEPPRTAAGVSSKIQLIKPLNARSGIRKMPWRRDPNAVLGTQVGPNKNGRKW